MRHPAGGITPRLEPGEVGDVESPLDQPAQQVAGELAVLPEDDLRALLRRDAEGIAGAPSPQGLVAGVDRKRGIVGHVEHVALVVADHDQGVRPERLHLLAQGGERGLDPLDVPVDDGRRRDLHPRAVGKVFPGLRRYPLQHPRPVLCLLEHHRRV